MQVMKIIYYSCFKKSLLFFFNIINISYLNIGRNSTFIIITIDYFKMSILLDGEKSQFKNN